MSKGLKTVMVLAFSPLVRVTALSDLLVSILLH